LLREIGRLKERWKIRLRRKGDERKRREEMLDDVFVPEFDS